MANVINKTTFKELKSVNSPDYPSSDWIHNYDVSHMSGIPKKYWITDNNTIREMTDEEKFEKDQTFLDSYKTQRLVEVDAKTQELISEGFYHNGVKFSLSLPAQFNWNSLITLASGGGIPFPYPISAFNDSDEYELQDMTDLQIFVGTAFDQVGRVIACGRRIKLKISEQTLYSNVEKIEDDRTIDSTIIEIQTYLDTIVFDEV